MRSIQVLGEKVTAWEVPPADTKDFEEAALRACELVLAGDPRIGKYLECGAPREGGPSSRQDPRSRRNSPKVQGTHVRSSQECFAGSDHADRRT